MLPSYLTSLRIRTPHVLRRVSARKMQQAALATPPYAYPPPIVQTSLTSSVQPMWDISAELERRVKALEQAAVAEVRCFSDSLSNVPNFHSFRKLNWILQVTPNKTCFFFTKIFWHFPNLTRTHNLIQPH
jgi:hypothetical protein